MRTAVFLLVAFQTNYNSRRLRLAIVPRETYRYRVSGKGQLKEQGWFLVNNSLTVWQYAPLWAGLDNFPGPPKKRPATVVVCGYWLP